MTVRNHIGLALAALLLVVSGCAMVTPYQAERYGYGYSEPVVEEGVYKVTFHGNANTSRELLEDYLLLRMAELTLAEGHAYFTVEEQGTDCFITVRTSPTSECTIHQSHTDIFPYYSLEREPRWLWQRRTTSKKEYEAIAFFVMQDDLESVDSSHTYLASEVVERLSHLKP